MKVTVCSIRDVKAETFAQPWFTATPATAVRQFTDLVNNKEHGGQLYTHPEDFQLYEIAIFDDSLGTFDLYTTPKHLVSASSVKHEMPHSNITKA